MEYTKLQLVHTRSRKWLIASPEARGAAISILAYIDDQELPGRITEGISWSERDWRLTCMMERSSVQEAIDAKLCLADGNDLICTLWSDPRSPVVRFNILERDCFRCRYCGAGPEARLQIDHIMPRARGGTDDPDNLATACWACNNGKSDRVLRALP